MQGCKNSTDINPTYGTKAESHEHPIDPVLDEVIIVRRQTQTIRAVEPRTGGERWNFSVGQHEIELLKPSDDCHTANDQSETDSRFLDLELKVIVPEGVICAVDKNAPNVIVWKHKFDFPIVNAWRKGSGNEMESIDLFQASQWIWNANDGWRMSVTEKEDTDDEDLLEPSIYIGMFEKQLYIQESDRLKSMVQRRIQFSEEFLQSDTNSYARIPWNPFPATSAALALITNSGEAQASGQLIPTGEGEASNGEVNANGRSVTALSILYGTEYVNGNGFYLYSTKDLKEGSNETCNNDNDAIIFGESEEDDEDSETPTQVIIVSLWYWWKEILVISLTTALVLNVMLQHRRFTAPVSH